MYMKNKDKKTRHESQRETVKPRGRVITPSPLNPWYFDAILTPPPFFLYIHDNTGINGPSIALE